jgi:8-oxo-dGTP pyrophosphatase MutT (NUDIX family)
VGKYCRFIGSRQALVSHPEFPEERTTGLYFSRQKGYDHFHLDIPIVIGSQTMPSYDDIENSLADRRAPTLPADHRTHAAVALILRTPPSGLELLFIKRATLAGDPWSGDLGFPGGKMEAGDGSLQLAAERETREEIGLELTDARLLGRLADITGAHLPVRVSCFVYGLVGTAKLHPGDEISAAFWIPFSVLSDPERHIETSVSFAGTTLLRPAIRILEPGQTVLWGITYRLVSQFLKMLGSPLSPPVRASAAGQSIPKSRPT